MIRGFITQINSIVMALLLAVVIWSVATSEENPSREAFYPDQLPIEVVNLPDGMVVYQQSASTVQLRIRAPEASWNQLSPRSFHVVADLQGLGAGLNQVPLKLEYADPQISVTTVEPATIGIRLEPIKSKVVDIHVDILDTAPPGFNTKPATPIPGQATVSGAGILVDQVTEVVADLFLRGAKTPIEREVVLVARDSQGNIVQGVTITPALATVNVPIEQRVGYKDVSVKAVLKGVPAAGYWVSNIVVTPSTATIAGSADVLAKIPGFVETLPVDVTGATADVTKRTALALADTVTVLNNEGVVVQVSVTPLLGGQSVPRKVVVLGLRRGLVTSVSPAQVDVILSGPLPALQNLSPEDVQVTVDASNLSAGTFQLRPRVPFVPDGLRVQSIVPDSVEVTITEAVPSPLPTRTLMATRTLTATLTISTTFNIVPTLRLTATPPASRTPPPR